MWIVHAHRARVGNKLLSELVVIKPRQQWQFIDSDDVGDVVLV